jgi:hypothetical protein
MRGCYRVDFEAKHGADTALHDSRVMLYNIAADHHLSLFLSWVTEGNHT